MAAVLVALSFLALLELPHSPWIRLFVQVFMMVDWPRVALRLVVFPGRLILRGTVRRWGYIFGFFSGTLFWSMVDVSDVRSIGFNGCCSWFVDISVGLWWRAVPFSS